MNMIVSVSALSAAGVIPADASNPDAMLISQAKRLTSFMPEFLAVRERFNRIEQEYFAQRPARPQALLWQSLLHDGGIDGITVNDIRDEKTKTRARWCCVEDLAALRGPQGYWTFTGPEEMWEQAKWPAPAEQRHWWTLKRHERMEARAREIADAHEEHLRQDRAVEMAVGLEHAREEYGEASERGRELENIITETPAHTFAGIKAKAAALVTWLWEGDMEGGFDGVDDDMLRSIIRDLAVGHSTPTAPAAAEALPVPIAA